MPESEYPDPDAALASFLRTLAMLEELRELLKRRELDEPEPEPRLTVVR